MALVFVHPSALFLNGLQPLLLTILNTLYRQYHANAHRSAAVSSAYGERRTMGVTAVERAADDRRTMTLIE